MGKNENKLDFFRTACYNKDADSLQQKKEMEELK
jgi:hypothetical protein